MKYICRLRRSDFPIEKYCYIILFYNTFLIRWDGTSIKLYYINHDTDFRTIQVQNI